MAKTTTKNPVSKAEQTRKLYARNLKLKRPLERKAMVEKFIDKVGLTKNGANTYYTNCMNNPELNAAA